MRRALVLAALAAIVFQFTGVLPACVPAEGRVFVDSVGREVEIPDEIVAVAPSGPLAQIALYTLAPDRLAGVAADFSQEAAGYIDDKYMALPRFGQFYGKNVTLNMEALIAAAPQAIVDVGEPKGSIREDMDALQNQLGIPTVFVRATLDTLPDAYAMLGELLGEKERAEALSRRAESILAHAESVSEDLKDGERARVYLAMGKAGLNTNARGSFHAEVLDRVGVLNVADVQPDSKGAGSAVSLEQILLWNPEFILAETEEVRRQILEDPAWSDIEAVQKGRVYRIPNNPYSFIASPPSVNRLLGIIWLGHLAYPEQYTSELKDDVVEFFKLFYSIELSDGQYGEIMKGAL